jgi:nitrate reductase NapD
MNISGILVVVRPEAFAESVARLNALPGVEVHHTDEEAGKIVATQEATSVSEEVAGLQRVKQLPDVIMAEMVYHYFGDGADETAGALPAGSDGLDSLDTVPPSLNE